MFAEVLTFRNRAPYGACMTGAERERDSRYWLTFGQWMTERLREMKPDRWTQDRLVAELSAAGTQVKRPWISQVANGHRASPELKLAIERLLGTFPDPEPSAPDQAALVAAINSLVEELRLSRQEQHAWNEGVQAVVEQLGARAFATPRARPAPGPRAGVPR